MIVTRTAGGLVYHESIRDINKALMKMIKHFSLSVDTEALHLANETGTSLPFAHPSKSTGAPIGRLPAEIWQDILLLAIGPDGDHPFATTCTVSTLLHFLKHERDPDGSYLGYMRRRATLRQVCRSWNQFLESTDTWWVHVKNPYHPQQSFGLPPIPDGVAVVKRLSMVITTYDCIRPGLNWASDLFQKVQAPILSYNIDLLVPCENNLIHEPCASLLPVTAKSALRSLRIACPHRRSCGAIALSQLHASFNDLVSLFLSGSVIRTEELTLPRLELLHISIPEEPALLPTQRWNLPRLRHIYIARIPSTTDFTTVLNSFRRYASQLESLFLDDYFTQNGLPHGFWDSFTSLQLLGFTYDVLWTRGWSGWDITPPRSHPFRYLVCKSCLILEVTVDLLRPKWTYHEGVALVIAGSCGKDYMIEDVKKEGWRMRMSETSGILPTRCPDKGADS